MMMKYLITVLDLRREPPAIAVLYCGRRPVRIGPTLELARQRFAGRDLRIRIVTSQDGEVISIADGPI